MNLLHLLWQVPVFIVLFVAFFITFIGEKGTVSWSNVIIFKLIQLAILTGAATAGYGIFTSIASVF